MLPKPLVWTLAIISESLTWLSFVPPPIVCACACVCVVGEWLTTICYSIRRGKLKGQFFKLTPAVLTIAMADIYLNDSRARKDFGYAPPYTMDDAFAQCSDYYRSP